LVSSTVEDATNVLHEVIDKTFSCYVCLGTSNGSGIGEFDKCLECALFRGRLLEFLKELCALKYDLHPYSYFMLELLA